MGEYATTRHGRDVKLGTCESLYYLRWDQLDQLTEQGRRAVIGEARIYRFRFPFPDEDHLTLDGGQDDGMMWVRDFDRAYRLPGDPRSPEGVEHYSVQFKADGGYLLSVPCPEQWTGEAAFLMDENRLTIGDVRLGRNGYQGAAGLNSLAWRQSDDGEPPHLVPILKCLACDTKWNVPDLPSIEALVVSLRSEGDRVHEDSWIEDPDTGEKTYTGGVVQHEIARRILEAWETPAPEGLAAGWQEAVR